MENSQKVVMSHSRPATIIAMFDENDKTVYGGTHISEFLKDDTNYVTTLKDAVVSIEKANTDKYIKPFKSINDSEFWREFECVHPHDVSYPESSMVFKRKKPIVSNIYKYYIKHKGYYFTANRRNPITVSECIEEIEEKFFIL
jgi:hypothetical protein